MHVNNDWNKVLEGFVMLRKNFINKWFVKVFKLSIIWFC